MLIGQVIHAYSRLASKEKFHIVVSETPKTLLLYINSEITSFQKLRKDLIACNAKLLEVEHEFLKYDSYVNCCEAVSESVLSEPIEIVGNISDKGLDSIIEAVNASKLLSIINKRIILESLS